MLIKHLSTPQIMRQVIYALIPAIIAYYIFFGTLVIIHLIIAILSAYLTEFIALSLRGYDFNKIKNSLLDSSGVVTAVLFALSVPITLPWYLIFFGVFFGLIFAKHIFGGLGNNIFNPAMLGFVFLLISFPQEMSNHSHFMLDGVSGATMLDSVKHNLTVYQNANNMLIINLLFAVGGLYLLIKKIIYWQIPVAMLSSVFIMGLIVDNIALHLLFGGVMLGAFFIATDGVSSPLSNIGRIIYATIIGFLVVIIREFGAYPDGVAFAVLIANIITPLIDYYFKK
jgi:electron transport complex protein RnfD